MIGKRGNVLVMAPGTFEQLRTEYLFPVQLMKKQILGYAVSDKIWIIYQDEREMVRVPFARNRKWFQAMLSEPEFAAFGKLPQIYIV
jgi:hypothetical protein